MKNQEKANKNSSDAFITPVIGTAAAILATGRVKFLKIEPASFNPSRKLIFLIPREIAEDLYQKLILGKLLVDASANILWVEKLKEKIFRQGITK